MKINLRYFNFSIVKLVLIVLVGAITLFIFFEPVRADVGENIAKTSDLPDPNNPADRAKFRLYDGGMDEQDLIVRPNLPLAEKRTSNRYLQKSILKMDIRIQNDEDDEEATN